MALETNMNLEDQVEGFNYDYVEDQETNEESDNVSTTNLLSGIGDFVSDNSSLLFFFLILVIIFNGSGTFSESNESLLFFFLILVILFNQFY